MKIINENLLDEFRTPGKCEWCRKHCKSREPNHLWCRGHGGGFRLDIRINLISLGRSEVFACPCHNLYHAGKVSCEEMTELVAKREKVLPSELTDAIFCLQALPPRLLDGQIEDFLSKWPLSGKTLDLARLCLIESGVFGRE